MEFTKLLMMLLFCLLALSIVGDYILVFFDKEPLEKTTEAVFAVVTGIIGMVGQNVARNMSLNNNKMIIPNDGSGKQLISDYYNGNNGGNDEEE